MPPTPAGHHVSLDFHRVLLNDAVRMDAYERAIRALVRPTDVVLDLGTGTGILAMLAARRGARVHAVESASVARVARALIARNGLDERIVLHEADIAALPVVEPVDLVITECLGRFLVDDGMMESAVVAGRWLGQGGRFCPAEIRLNLAPVGDFPFPPMEGWEAAYGIDLGPCVGFASNWCYAGRLGEGAFYAPARRYYVWRPPEPPRPFDAELAFEVSRAGTIKALAGWVEAELCDDVTVSARPGVDTHWGQYLFPLPATSVSPGDVVRVRLWLVGDVWHWHGSVGGREFALSSIAPNRADIDAGTRPIADRDTVVAWNREAAELHQAGQIEQAIAGYERAIAALTPETDDLAPPLYENLGLARLALGRYDAALRDFLRAGLSRQQSLRYAVVAAWRAGRPHDASRWLAAYVERFGPHPDATGPVPE